MKRRHFLHSIGAGSLASVAACTKTRSDENATSGSQRLSLSALKKWEATHYGMFIHFGMSTFVGEELPSGKHDPSVYAPTDLDVDQWVNVARDAGMKYAVLTTKHVAGHCLWPTRHTSYNVANSADTTNVVEKFVRVCETKGVQPGFYYCSWDNHNRFGSKTPSDGGWVGMTSFPKNQQEDLPPYTTSLYQNFQTAQIDELLTQFGEIFETWIDIPGLLSKGYRRFLYNHIAELQPQTVIMMNSGIGDGTEYDVDYAWPSDLIAIERDRPPESGHEKWRTINGKTYYMPGEHCDPIGKEWFYKDGDLARSDAELAEQFEQTREAGVNFLLNVPPDRRGQIPDNYVQALMRLRQNVKI